MGEVRGASSREHKRTLVLSSRLIACQAPLAVPALRRAPATLWLQLPSTWVPRTVLRAPCAGRREKKPWDPWLDWGGLRQKDRAGFSSPVPLSPGLCCFLGLLSVMSLWDRPSSHPETLQEILLCLHCSPGRVWLLGAAGSAGPTSAHSRGTHSG